MQNIVIGMGHSYQVGETREQVGGTETGEDTTVMSIFIGSNKKKFHHHHSSKDLEKKRRDGKFFFGKKKKSKINNERWRLIV